jgi:uncharacterized protein YjbI with pentapeptide repeats
MANAYQVAILKRSVSEWNAWRERAGHDWVVQASLADLRGADLSGSDLRRADLTS